MIIATEYFEKKMSAEVQARRAASEIVCANEECKSEERQSEHLEHSIIMLKLALKNAEAALKYHKK